MSGTANGTDSSGNSGKQSDDKKGSWKGAVGCGICSAAVLFGLSGVAIWVEDVFAHGRLPDTLQQDCFAMTAILLVGAFAGMFFSRWRQSVRGQPFDPNTTSWRVSRAVGWIALASMIAVGIWGVVLFLLGS